MGDPRIITNAELVEMRESMRHDGVVEIFKLFDCIDAQREALQAVLEVATKQREEGFCDQRYPIELLKSALPND